MRLFQTILDPRLVERVAALIPCEYCGAPSGAPCTTSSGAPSHHHDARRSHPIVMEVRGTVTMLMAAGATDFDAVRKEWREAAAALRQVQSLLQPGTPKWRAVSATIHLLLTGEGLP